MLFDQIAISIALATSLNGEPIIATSGTANLSRLSGGLAFHQTATTSYLRAIKSSRQSRMAAISREDYFAQKLVDLPLTLRPGTDHRKESKPTINSARQCRSIIYQTYVRLPKEHTQYLTELTLYYTPDGRRGLGGLNVAIIRCLNVKKPELAAVFTHEIGHVVDSLYLTGTNNSQPSGFYDFDLPVRANDPSSEYYKISWINEKTRKSTAAENDFVSTYSMSDPFEDFAETYMFYRLHGSSFRLLAQKNQVLAEKYNFMKIRVFNGEEFGSDLVITYADKNHRQYDATVIPFNLDSFFNETQRY